ncbi:hypothetical protein B0T25DRAFT_572453 [Lasiosphaeria hispida]|uniref:AIG1-type G domain-containing protein n=1 Tax=Lasiosphaeria hispida TaxID=260671 RepID=A0AAJ0M928_9PEZI|nr:hypothetical protein B0T25DRAFT_572453 [Lasiosphaeria hispida]
MAPDIVLLLLGSTRSGKTSFASCVAKPKDGKTDRGSTTTCKEYETDPIDGKTFRIIDTPGLDDAPAGNLAVLNKIAEQLQKGTEVNGVIYFHRVTNARLTGSARANIEIFRKICGAPFFYQTAFVTTMWNTISKDQLSRFHRLNGELRGVIANLTNGSTEFFEFDSRDAGTAKKILEHFAVKVLPKIRRKNTEQLLQLATDVKLLGSSPSGVRRTHAGKQIVKDLNRGFCVIL